MVKILEKLKQGYDLVRNKDDIGEPPWEYDFLINLDENEYPKYLRKIYFYRTGKELPLVRDKVTGNLIIDKNKCKTFNEKMQWIKLYDASPIKKVCTDKLLVRDFVAEKTGNRYLKNKLQVCNAFDEIDFEKLPNAFVMKCNHGCKWHYIIENKKDYQGNKRLFENSKRQMNGWLEQEFWPWEGFEMHYKGISPKILIEPFMKENRLIEIYCFSGKAKIYADVHLKGGIKICIYNEDFSYSDLVLKNEDKKHMTQFPADDQLKEAVELSEKLSKEFKFVRADWMVYENHLYFEELTFTTYSGFTSFEKKWNETMGNWIEI